MSRGLGSGMSPCSPEHTLDACLMPVSKENREPQVGRVMTKAATGRLHRPGRDPLGNGPSSPPGQGVPTSAAWSSDLCKKRR